MQRASGILSVFKRFSGFKFFMLPHGPAAQCRQAESMPTANDLYPTGA